MKIVCRYHHLEESYKTAILRLWLRGVPRYRQLSEGVLMHFHNVKYNYWILWIPERESTVKKCPRMLRSADI